MSELSVPIAKIDKESHFGTMALWLGMDKRMNLLSHNAKMPQYHTANPFRKRQSI